MSEFGLHRDRMGGWAMGLASWLGSVLCLSWLLVGSARASCGLELCPAVGTGIESGVSVMEQTRYTRVEDSRTWYLQHFLGVQVLHQQSFRLGALLPVVSLFDEDGGRHGLGSSVVFGQWMSRVPWGSAGGGLQVELPTSSHPELGDRHFLLLPYGVLHRTFGSGWTTSRIGLAQVLGSDGEHHHGDETSVVDPHGHTELEGRFELGASPMAFLGVSGLVDGRWALGHHGGTEVALGAAVGLARERAGGQLWVLVPVTPEPSHELRVGLTMEGWVHAIAIEPFEHDHP